MKTSRGSNVGRLTISERCARTGLAPYEPSQNCLSGLRRFHPLRDQFPTAPPRPVGTLKLMYISIRIIS